MMTKVRHFSVKPKEIGRGFSSRLGSWLRHYATSREVSSSISDEVIGFLNLTNPSSCTMALGSTQTLDRNEYQESCWGQKPVGA
jgi:hypothetical protein